MNKIILSAMTAATALGLVMSQANAALLEAPAQAPSAQAAAKPNTMNITLNVLPSIIGLISGSLNFKVSPALTVGPTAMYWAWHFGEDKSDGVDVEFPTIWSIGAQAQYALNGHIMTSGWLVNPWFLYQSVKYNNKNDIDKDEGESGIGAGADMLYQWMWDSGVNLQLGLGLGYYSAKTAFASASSVGVNLQFSFGYAF